ncbi:hypothetical protein GGX14DRAFT_353190 [Mycena pura]|uniref:Uncharacterized protein n=1 Tax=Mycena pura TaxID=153505 RepID=A0AAD6VV68_9AGAR|nr:hypothetical protein GGX14DRAFT_353190 [Mycena pura]
MTVDNSGEGASVPEPTSFSRQPGSTFLAQKIRGLISSFPALSSRFLLSPKDPPAIDSDGRPIPPQGALRVQDPELISLLSNPSIMNGSDGRRQSVWSMLDAMQSPSLVGNVQSVDGNDEYGSDRSSIMMYSPLIPTADSVIELAEVETVPTPDPSPSDRWFSSLWPDWSTIWPFTEWKNTNVTQEHESSSRLASTVLSLETESSADPQERRRAAPIRRVWIPSTTQLSFETMWWGYRIYLPPPVLAILDDQSVEAAKQATVLTAALTWFFTNLPVSSFPPPLQPAMILLQRLVPFISYLGTFISWSWGTIRGFDKGHGVILTATWLLPIALIPGTWHGRDVPPPSAPVSPAPSFPPLLLLPSEMSTSIDEEAERVPPIPSAPRLTPVPLPPSSDDLPLPAPHGLQKSASKGKSRMKIIRKLTRPLT